MSPRRIAPITGSSGLLALGVVFAACSACDSECDPPEVPEVVLRGRFEVTERFLDGRDAVTIVGDCNGDDRIDVVNGATLFVQRPDGGFTPAPLDVASGRKAGTMVDLDGDGALDLVLAGADVVALAGDGQCHFGDARVIAPPTAGEAAQVLVQDVDQDGLADLSVARQERRDVAFQLLVARGDGRFEDRAPPPTPKADHLDRPYRTFGTFFDDVDRDGALDLFAILDDDLGWLAWGSTQNPRSFQQDSDATEHLAAVSPMSLSPIDYDRDGTFEYFISGTFGHHRLYHPTGGRALDDRAERSGVCVADTDLDGWGSSSLDVDLDGYADLLVREEPDDHHDGGPVRLLVNRRDGTFGRAARTVLDATLQGTSLACADLAADGRVSCLARDVGARGLVLLRNRVEPAGNWVGLRLRGTVSSPDASGARVSLDGVSPPLVAMVGGQSPTLGEHDRGVILAIGSASTASVTVTWPSGIRQRVTGLAASRYTAITEPRALTVSSRSARADGTSRVTVTAAPALTGATRASIECEGACVWEGPAVADSEGMLRRVLRAPSAPGEARVTLRLDGVALRVRPRVHFE